MGWITDEVAININLDKTNSLPIINTLRNKQLQ